MPASYLGAPSQCGGTSRAGAQPVDIRNTTPEKHNTSQTPKTVAYPPIVFSLLACGLTHDDDSAQRNSSCSSTLSNDGSTEGVAVCGQLNGVDKGCQRSSHTHIDATRFADAQAIGTPGSFNHHGNGGGVDARLLRSSASVEGSELSVTQCRHAQHLSSVRRPPYLSLVPFDAVRVLPNPHTSLPRSVVCAPTRSLHRYTFGAGHLADFDDSEVRCNSIAVPEWVAPDADGVTRERTSTLDPPVKEAEEEASVWATSTITGNDGAAAAGRVQLPLDGQGDVSQQPFAAPAEAPRFASTHPSHPTQETDVADISSSGKPSLLTPPPSSRTSAVAVEAGRKDHLAPVRSSLGAVRRSSRMCRSGHSTTIASAERRSRFSSLPTLALSPPSSIPPMTVSPQSVVDHFHDAYGGIHLATMKDAATCASYPPSTASTHTDDANAHLMPSQGKPDALGDASTYHHGMEMDGKGEEEYAYDDDGDAPPLLSLTRRQSYNDLSESVAELNRTEDVVVDVAPLAVTPPAHTARGEAEGSSDRSFLDHALHSTSPETRFIDGDGDDGGNGTTALLSGYRSPPETSATVAFHRASFSTFTAALPHAPGGPRSFFTEVSPVGEGSTHVESGAAAPAAAAVLRFALPQSSSTNSPPEMSPLGGDCDSLPTSPPSPPITAAQTTAPLVVTPPEATAVCKPGSLPRRPPRALFSNVSSPQQLALQDSATNTPAKLRAAAGTLTSAALANVAAAASAVSDKTQRCGGGLASTMGRVEKEGGSSGRTSSPTSLPTSPEELDLAQLVQQHVSQRIAQSYAQSCSYYLHYHSQPGSVPGGAGGRVSQSCPTSPEDYMWEEEEDEDDLEAMATEVEQQLQARVADNADVVGAAAAAATAMAATTTTATTCERSAARLVQLTPQTLMTTTTTTTTTSASAGEVRLQQPRWRRFSSAVPRRKAM